jgi:general transcription factor IIIA
MQGDFEDEHLHSWSRGGRKRKALIIETLTRKRKVLTFESSLEGYLCWLLSGGDDSGHAQ